MNRFTVAKVLRFLFHLHYDVRISGDKCCRTDVTYLILPNHSAYIDPLLLLSELWWLPIRPMVDELFMRHWFSRRILRLVGAMEVPDLCHSQLSREQGAACASALSQLVITCLQNGEPICFYPSGHIKTIDKEVIGNRRMAYEVCNQLPNNTRVILCRMRGLESSRSSKLRPKQWKWRRTVFMHFEDRTEDVRQWASGIKDDKMRRRSFNQQLEEWYNKV